MGLAGNQTNTQKTAEMIKKISADPAQTATLAHLLEYKAELEDQIKESKKQMRKAAHAVDKETYASDIKDLKEQLHEVEQNFIKVATGLDISLFSEEVQQSFEWQEEIETLIKPLLHELKEMTKRPRQIERLKTQVAYFESRLPRAKEAVVNIDRLIASTNSKLLKSELKELKEEFEQRQTNISNQLDVAKFQLNELLKEKNPSLNQPKK